VDQAALRLDRLVNIAATATPLATDLPAPDGRNWYLAWAARLAQIREEALATSEQPNDAATVLQVAPSSEEELARSVAQLQQWMQQCDEIFGVDHADRPLLQPAEQTDMSAWELTHQAADNWTHCVAEGDSPRLIVNVDAALAIPRQTLLRDLLVVLAIATVAIALIRRPAVWEQFWRWPHAVVFLLGMAFWAWLSPSWLGLLIAAVSVWLALRRGWPGRSLAYGSLSGSQPPRHES
jgi:hypothetical protein